MLFVCYCKGRINRIVIAVGLTQLRRNRRNLVAAFYNGKNISRVVAVNTVNRKIALLARSCVDIKFIACVKAVNRKCHNRTAVFILSVHLNDRSAAVRKEKISFSAGSGSFRPHIRQKP